MSNKIIKFMSGEIIHLPTFLLCIIMIEVFLSLMMILYWRQRGGYPGFGIWAVQLLFMAVGQIGLLLRGSIPDIISILITHVFHLMGLLLIFEAATRFITGRPLARQWYFLISIDLIGILFWYHYDDNLAYRTVLFSLCALAVTIPISLIFYYQNKKWKDLFSFLLLCVYGVLSGIFLFRAVNYLLFPENRTLLEGTFINNLLFFYMLIASIGATILFFILNFERMAGDLDHSHQRVARMAKKYDLAISTAGAGIWELNLITGNLIVDPQLLRMFGKDPDLYDSTHFTLEQQIIHEDFILVKKEIQSISHEDQEIQCNYRVRMPDGEIRYFLLHAKSFASPNGPGLRLIGLNTDITSLRKTENALKEAMRKLSILSSITRHDILNCITVINLNAELLEQVSEGNEEQKRIKDITTAGDEITRLIRFTGEYENLGQYEPAWIDIVQVLSKEDFKKMCPGFSLILPPRGTLLYVDKMIEKVLYNLIENSLRHGQHVHTITFSYEHEGTDLLVLYTDDGIGIEEEDKEKIFNHGYGKNTGLGLFLSKEILGITGLTIREDGKPGSGVRFVIRAGPGLFQEKS